MRAFLRSLAAVLAVTLLFSPLAAAEDRVLLVALSHWQDEAVPDLGESATADLAMMRDLAMTVWGFEDRQIKVLKNDEATVAAVGEAFEDWLIAGTQPGDRVLYYFSGHGTQVPDTSGDEADRLDEAVPLFDTLRAKPETYLGDDQLAEWFKALADRNVSVVLDTCSSGTATRALSFAATAAPGDGAAKKFAPFPLSETAAASLVAAPPRRDEVTGAGVIDRPGRMVVWSAAAPDQIAWGDAVTGGIFTGALHGALKARTADLNANGTLSFAELLSATRALADAFCKDRPAGAPCPTPFTPMLEASVEMLTRDAGTEQFVRGAEPGPPPVVTAAAAGDLVGYAAADGLKLEALPSPNVALGEAIRIRVTSSAPGYLVLLDLRQSGEMVQLFPNSLAGERSRKVEAGRPLTVPDATYGMEFVADAADRGQIIAILAEDEVDLKDLTGGHLDLAPIADPNAYLTQLSAELNKAWFPETGDVDTATGKSLAAVARDKPAGPPPPRAVRWGAAALSYTIE